MDPITAFVTSVSLIADFVAHRGANEAKDFDSFMAWLSEQRHDELRTMLQSNAATTVSVKALLRDSREVILDRLASLDKTLATVAAGIDQYRDIAQIAYPTYTLSNQALSLLEQFYDSGATSVMEVKYQSEATELAVIDGLGNAQIKYAEPRFLEDDLTTLVEFGLLALDFSGSGRIFKFKRTAAALIEQRRGA